MAVGRSQSSRTTRATKVFRLRGRFGSDRRVCTRKVRLFETRKLARMVIDDRNEASEHEEPTTAPSVASVAIFRRMHQVLPPDPFRGMDFVSKPVIKQLCCYGLAVASEGASNSPRARGHDAKDEDEFRRKKKGEEGGSSRGTPAWKRVGSRGSDHVMAAGPILRHPSHSIQAA